MYLYTRRYLYTRASFAMGTYNERFHALLARWQWILCVCAPSVWRILLLPEDALMSSIEITKEYMKIPQPQYLYTYIYICVYVVVVTCCEQRYFNIYTYIFIYQQQQFPQFFKLANVKMTILLIGFAKKEAVLAPFYIYTYICDKK